MSLPDLYSPNIFKGYLLWYKQYGKVSDCRQIYIVVLSTLIKARQHLDTNAQIGQSMQNCVRTGGWSSGTIYHSAVVLNQHNHNRLWRC